jgi:general secretion pathway protein G
MEKHKRDTDGFTLIELLIVMVIISLLAALVAPRFFGQEKKAKQRGAKGQIALLESAVDTYRLDIGRYPSTEQGLEALRERPDGIDKWDGPYLRKELPLVKASIWISSAGKISANER